MAHQQQLSSSADAADDDEANKLDGMEALALQVADLMTPQGSGGGLLEVVKDLNRFLESAEKALRVRNG